MSVLNGLALCLVLSSLGLYLSGAVGPVHAGLLLLCLAYQRWRWSGRGGAPGARRIFWEWASLAALFVFIADLFVASRNLIGAALRLLLFIVAYHADNPQPARRARQTFGLSLIQMVAASASTTESSFSFLMAGYLLAALWTLAAMGAAEAEEPTAPLRRSAPDPRLRVPLMKMVGRLIAPVSGLALGIFFVIPHYGTGYFREAGKTRRQHLTGFSDTIQLGSISSIKKNHAVVMRIHRLGIGGAPPLPLRMRGLAFDSYNGKGWSISDWGGRNLSPDHRDSYLIQPDLAPAGGAPLAGVREAESGNALDPNWLGLEIFLEPLDTRVLFTPPDLVRLSTTWFHVIYMNRQGSLFAKGPTIRRFPYRTASLVRREPREDLGEAPPEGSRGYLQLPELDPGIDRLGRSIVPDSDDPMTRARAIESFLLRNYPYSLDVNDVGEEAPMTRFLIDRKPGQCEYFATGMVILLRLQGIPSRIVNGFNGGEHSEFTDQTIIRQSDAHSWVEAWIPGRGWTTFDPTPPDEQARAAGLLARLRRFVEEAEIAWDTYIVGLDLDDQMNALDEMRDRFDLAVSGAAIGVRGLLRGLRGALRSPAEALRGAGRILAAAAILAVMALAAARLVRARRRGRAGSSRPHPATILFGRFERRAARRGLRRDAVTTPAAFARELGAPEVAAAFEAARYGPEEIGAAALEKLRSAIDASRTARA